MTDASGRTAVATDAGIVPAAPVRASWGAAATIAFTVMILVAFVIVQSVLAIPYVLVRAFAAGGDVGESVANVAGTLDKDGLFLALSEIFTAPLVIGLTLLVAWLRKGPAIRDYFAVRRVPGPVILRWLLYTAVFAALLEVSSVLAGQPSVPDWMKDIWRSAAFLPLLLFAIVVVAPVVEELLFRGFFYEGLHRSRLGPVGTLVLASLIWTAIHMQYGWFHLGQVFATGVVLGVARLATGSIVPPVLMHALLNVTASVQAAIES